MLLFSSRQAMARGVALAAPASATQSPASGDFPSSVLVIASLSTALLCWLGLTEGFVVTSRAIIAALAPTLLTAGLFAFYRGARQEPVFAHIFWALGLMTFVSYVDAWL